MSEGEKDLPGNAVWDNGIATGKGGARKRAQARSLKRAKDVFQEDDTDYARDPRYAVPVSRHGLARPPIKRDMVSFDVDVEGRMQTKKRLKDQLDKLRESGNISDNAYKAARKFQQCFLRCGYDRCGTVNLQGASGGGMSIEDIYTRANDARDYVFHVLELLGGQTSFMAQVVCHYVGYMQDVKMIANQKGKTRHYWTGVLHSALETMGNDLAARERGKARKSAIVGIPSTDLQVPR